MFPELTTMANSTMGVTEPLIASSNEFRRRTESARRGFTDATWPVYLHLCSALTDVRIFPNYERTKLSTSNLIIYQFLIRKFSTLPTGEWKIWSSLKKFLWTERLCKIIFQDESANTILEICWIFSWRSCSKCAKQKQNIYWTNRSLSPLPPSVHYQIRWFPG